MDWKKVGDWLKKNAVPGLSVAGALVTGGVPAAIAMGASLIQSATGQSDPDEALKVLQSDPQAVIRLKELVFQNEENIRQHLRATEEARLKDLQAEHREQQDTIRSGDNSQDEYVRHTRPMMARWSFYVTAFYVLASEGYRAYDSAFGGARVDVAAMLASPAWAYLGFRTADKISAIFKVKR